MRRYVAIVVAVSAVLLAVFAFAEALDVGVLTDPSTTIERGGVVIALVAVGLLAADVVLPVPSSLVMASLGATYGLVVGTSLAAIGSLLAAVIAFRIGRRANGALDHIVGSTDREAFANWFETRGDAMVVASRPVPIIAETVAALAGTTTMRTRRFVVVALIGTLPAALAYTAAGAAVADLDNWASVLAAGLAVAAMFWLAGMTVRRRAAREFGGEVIVQGSVP